jgi:lysyl endopeptidase
MRRTVGLLAAVCATVAATGVALADSQPTARSVAAPVIRSGPKVGTLESVTGLLERQGKLVGGRKELTYSYPGASYVKVHFSKWALREGDRVTVSDRSGQETYTYTVPESLNDNWAMSITGDTAVVRLEQGSYDPLGLRTRLAGLGIGVDKVARGFPAERVGTEDAAPKNPHRSGREESICRGGDEKRNAVCYKSANPVAYQRSRAVARMLIDGVELCTAWRWGPNNRLMTNNHCVSNSYEVRHSEVWFGYECGSCGGSDAERSTKVYGDRLVAVDQTLDYALFSVTGFSSVQRYGFLEMDPNPARAGQELYIPQHPRGLPTMIATADPGERNGNCAVDNPSYFGYAANTDVSYYCDTEGGSSGSPVISASSHKVVALHHFGGCPNSGVRMDLIYDEVGRLL